MTRQQTLAATLVLSVLAIWVAAIRGPWDDLPGVFLVLLLNPCTWAAGYFFYKWRKKTSTQHLGEIIATGGAILFLLVTAYVTLVRYEVLAFGPFWILNPLNWLAAWWIWKSFKGADQNVSAEANPSEPSSSTDPIVAPLDTVPSSKNEDAPITNVVDPKPAVESKPVAEPKPEDEKPRPKFPADVVVMRVDGTSSFLTVAEHIRRGGKELAGCDLSSMTFERVSFCDANLNDAKIIGSSFRHCNFKGANLRGSQLDTSSFHECDFTHAKLNGCSARNCEFENPQFAKSTLRDIAFTDASLLRADLRNTILCGCDFQGANLREAKLNEADIQGVNFCDCDVIDADFHGVKYSDSTELPSGYRLPSDVVNMWDERRRVEEVETKNLVRFISLHHSLR